MKHLLTSESLTREETIALLDTASRMRELSGAKKLPTLRGFTVVNLFFEDSTRTRISFEAAAKRLSADVINFSAKGSSVSKGESLKDTALTLQAMGADAVVIRHPASGSAERLANAGWISGSVINAGDGTHQHPTQALLDAFTIRNHFGEVGGDLQGLSIAIVGDILHSRVARSNVFLLSTLGAKVHVVAPATLLPIGVEKWPCSVHFSLEEILGEVDAIMMLRIQSERMTDSYFPSELEYSKRYGLDQERFAMMQDHAIIMHPGPMNRGLEISAAVADNARSVIVEQVSNGVLIRMAVLFHILAGESL
ncbi:MAG: hypothetical protein RIS09_879 [Actinomycetota bacterium]